MECKPLPSISASKRADRLSDLPLPLDDFSFTSVFTCRFMADLHAASAAAASGGVSHTTLSSMQFPSLHSRDSSSADPIYAATLPWDLDVHEHAEGEQNETRPTADIELELAWH